MLIQPATTTTGSPVGLASASAPAGAESQVVRADIPPVFQPERDAEANNERDPGGSNDGDANSYAQTEEREKQGSSQESQSNSAATTRLSDEDRAIIDQLKVRDREVRLHEAAHAAVGGRYAGSPSFDYSRGPDGKNYATGGEVSISTSPVPGDPQATIEKARIVQAAALAPAQPSAQDRQVAAEAAQMELQAQSDLQRMKSEAAEESGQQTAEENEKKLAEARSEEAAAEEPEQADTESEPPTITVVQTASQLSDQSSDKPESDRDTRDQERPNPRQELEKILLGSRGTLQQANQLGLVDPQNPYGKSGLLDVIA
mgnify:CR=1 FL=1